jgi:hypothetical protein
MKRHNVFDRFIRNSHDNIAVAQYPNPPLIGWAVFGVLAFVFAKGTPHQGFHNLSQASLFTWAYLEIRGGSSPFRRTLGSVILLGVIAGYFKN